MPSFDDEFIEVLVSLTLILILLFVFNQIMPAIIYQSSDGSKLLAINAAKNQMGQTILTKDFKDASIQLNNQLTLKESIKRKDNHIHIEISVIKKFNKQKIHTLQAYILEYK
jgi:hypothetical protein